MQKPTVHIRIADRVLHERALEAIHGIAAITNDAAEADVVATDEPVTTSALVLQVSEVGADRLPDMLRKIVFAIARALSIRALDGRDLLASAVHEIRNPLGAVTVNLSFALPLSQSLPDVHEALADANEASSRVVRQIDDLIFLQRVLADDVVTQKRELDARDIVEAVVRVGTSAARGRNVSLKANASEAVMISGDRDMLVRGTCAMLDLALKFSVRSANIEVVATREEGKCSLVVRHDARPAEQHPPLAAWLEGKQRPGQVGFSLAVAAATARAHGGELHVARSARWPTEMSIVLAG